MTLKEFLGIINMQVRYRVTDRMTRESVKVSAKDKETLKRKIWWVKYFLTDYNLSRSIL